MNCVHREQKEFGIVSCGLRNSRFRGNTSVN